MPGCTLPYRNAEHTGRDITLSYEISFSIKVVIQRNNVNINNLYKNRYINIYIYIYIYIYMYIYIYIYIYVYIYMCVCMCVRMRVFVCDL